jgi:hypothetical protein
VAATIKFSPEERPRQKVPNQLRARPIMKIRNVLRTIFETHFFVGRNSNFWRERNVDIPMMNMKNGNTRSVGVKPFHSACRKGAYTKLHDPGLFTKIIPDMVIPRKMSSESSRLLVPKVAIVFIVEKQF